VLEELSDDKLAHLQHPTSVGGPPAINRLQVIHVTSPQFTATGFDIDVMVQEISDFPKVLLAFVKEMFQPSAPSVVKTMNKFTHLRPNFVIYDVSPEAMSCMWDCD